MKNYSLLAVFLGLVSCGTSARPDPRVAEIQSLHQQIVTAQQASAAQEKNAELVRLGRSAEARERFTDLLQQSRTNLASLQQLDPAKAQDPTQVALVGAAATKEAELLKSARATVTLNQYLITTAKKRSRTLDSLNQVITGVKK